ncbi:hypothetical protein N7489_004712 [Penicillium chrysogenum]|uniref:Pc08g00050 protein n=1 Tax=Penicillium rubens (strain ATCC 28089 / DSM 1075 / NRRL 1951 / Wisconsin 54-1255) TaxID=500485 RepID=B6GWJ7_PENRW|nr:uncharacterized protein N7489_004712 [Penicillium chrysogenum]KAJ5244616.1 hypothetical protein N7489_004712 [Penicillium chrysogenum]KAJ5277490.1 hypothetical protein N7524_003643 [Penicillium chrysogenum]KAJ5849015.1 hypothetical protein N7534_008333 [Penicillium rubens]CAP79243.1 Pc08g00050 [Penicillium rubens Wisconsin 54-1255]
MLLTKFSSLLLLATQAAAHGLITRIMGANGVEMPGLTVVDGTPRDCPSAVCGGQKDTAVIRDQEMGSIKASALGRTLISGPVDPKRVIMNFMTPNTDTRVHTRHFHQARQLINDAASVVTNAGGAILNGAQDVADKTPFGGAIKGAQSAVDDVAGTLPRTESGAVTPSGTVEKGVEGYAGKGSVNGLPSVSDAGVITMTYHQVNQDGAGPLSADIDATSGGTDIKAFKPAKVIQNIPGVAGFSTSSTMDYEVKVQLPSGMKCSGVVGNTKNVCIMRVRNNAISGPFGGSAAFTN